MADMQLSASEIDARAQELVTYGLSGQVTAHRHCAASETVEPVRAAVHERAAELCGELIAAAPGIWNGRDRLITDAENAMKGADRG